MSKELSIVVPFYNEEDIIEEFFWRLKEEVQKTGRSYELIFVDDGSTDATFSIMEKLRACEPKLRLVKFRWNFGQTAALAAGSETANGDIVIMMDGDLQHDPGDIPRFLAKIEEGWDLVSGYRIERNGDPWLTRRLPSWVANRLMAGLSGIKLRDFGTTLKAYRKDVIKNIPLYGDFHRFIPALAGSFKMSVCEIPVKQGVRSKGKSKYGLERTVTVFFDVIRIRFLVKYLSQPLRMFGGLGLISFVAGAAMFGSALIERYVHGLLIFQEQGALFAVSVFLMLMGLQLFSLGLLAELIVRLFFQDQRYKPYIVEKRLD